MGFLNPELRESGLFTAEEEGGCLARIEMPNRFGCIWGGAKV